MNIGRTIFVWGTPRDLRARWRLGLWCTIEVEARLMRKRTVVSVRGLLRWAAAAALVAYVAGVITWFVWQQRRPYNFVTYRDALLLPVRLPQVREALGRSLIQAGLDDLRHQRWGEGQMKLRTGLARAPQELQGRLELAQFYAATNRRPEALQLLAADLGQATPGRRYLKSLFELATGGEDYDVVVRVCDRLLPTATTERPWLLGQKLSALIEAGRCDEALRLAEAEGEEPGDKVREARASALIQLGRSGEALNLLAAWGALPGANQAQLLRLQAWAFRVAGRLPEMSEALAALRRLAPTEPSAYIYGVGECAQAGKAQEALRLLDECFFRFGGNAPRLLAMTSGLAPTKSVLLLRRCVEEAARHGYDLRPFKLLLVEAELVQGEWAAAIRTIAELQPLMKGAAPVERFGFRWMETLAAATHPNELQQSELVAFVQSGPMAMKVFRQTSEILMRAGRWGTAQKVLEVGARAYPDSPTLAAVRKQVDSALRDEQLAREKLPARAVAAVPVENEFFDAIEALTAAGQWEEAAQAARAVRAAKPAWLERREGDILERQIRIAGRTGDTPELLAAAGRYLNGSELRAKRALAVAGEMHARGEIVDAKRLLAEVLRKTPEFAPARQLDAAWRPKPPPTEAGPPPGAAAPVRRTP